MSQITAWAVKEQVNLDGIKTALDAILVGVATLDGLIQAFQNSPGALSAVDQAALDAIATNSAALVNQSQAIVLTPPPVTAPTTTGNIAVNPTTLQFVNSTASAKTVTVTGTKMSGPLTATTSPGGVVTTSISGSVVTVTPVSGVVGKTAVITIADGVNSINISVGVATPPLP
jgi:hypothetical protein